MKYFMQDLYFGRFAPWERERPQDPAYTPTTRKISDIKTYFSDTLPPEDYQKIDEMGTLYAQTGTIEDIEAFKYGLCMGALFMLEVLEFKDKQLTDA